MHSLYRNDRSFGQNGKKQAYRISHTANHHRSKPKRRKNPPIAKPNADRLRSSSRHKAVIPYNSLIWLYTIEQRINGIKSTKSIVAVTDEAKTYNIAVVPALTKKYMEVFDEVFTTISNKNTEMLVGYTPENCKIIHDKMKKIKQNKRLTK